MSRSRAEAAVWTRLERVRAAYAALPAYSRTEDRTDTYSARNLACWAVNLAADDLLAGRWERASLYLDSAEQYHRQLARILAQEGKL